MSIKTKVFVRFPPVLRFRQYEAKQQLVVSATNPGLVLICLRKTRLNVIVCAACNTLIIYKFLDCDWLREMQFLGNTVQETKLYFTDSKGHGLRFVDLDPFCVSVFQGSLLMIVIMIDGSEKRNCEGGF